MFQILPFHAAGRLRCIWALWAGLGWAVVPQSAQAVPPKPVAVAEPAASPSVLEQAQKCYVQSDLACTLRLLEPEDALGPGASLEARSERWRLLGFAASRLDHHELARRSFVAWIRLSERNRLDQASAPGGVYADYSSAQIEVLGGELDGVPHLDHRPVIAPPKPTAADLPRFAPPPRSARDQANDFGFFVGLGWATDPASQLGRVPDHLGLQLAMNLDFSTRWHGGLNLQVSRWNWSPGASPGPAGVTSDTSAMRVFAQLQAALALYVGDAGRLEALCDGGVGLDWTAGTIGALGLGMRYHGGGSRGALGWYLEAVDQLGLGSQVDQIWTLSLGLALRPVRAAQAPPRGS